MLPFVPVRTAQLRGCRLLLDDWVHGTDGACILTRNSEVVFFPVLISCVTFPSRLEEGIVWAGEQDLGSIWWKHLWMRSHLHMEERGLDAVICKDENNILPLRNAFLLTWLSFVGVSPSFRLSWEKGEVVYEGFDGEDGLGVPVCHALASLMRRATLSKSRLRA